MTTDYLKPGKLYQFSERGWELYHLFTDTDEISPREPFMFLRWLPSGTIEVLAKKVVQFTFEETLIPKIPQFILPLFGNHINERNV